MADNALRPKGFEWQLCILSHLLAQGASFRQTANPCAGLDLLIKRLCQRPQSDYPAALTIAEAYSNKT